jgi:hypothetical protein
MGRIVMRSVRGGKCDNECSAVSELNFDCINKWLETGLVVVVRLMNTYRGEQ